MAKDSNKSKVPKEKLLSQKRKLKPQKRSHLN